MTPQPKFIPKPGQIDFTHVKEAPVINCIVVHEGKILIVQRNPNMHFHPGKWNGISGFLDEPSKSIEEKVKEELEEEIGLKEHAIASIKEGIIIREEDHEYGKTWIVHPILAEVKTDQVKLDWEAERYQWIEPNAVTSFDLLPGFEQVVKTFFTI